MLYKYAEEKSAIHSEDLPSASSGFKKYLGHCESRKYVSVISFCSDDDEDNKSGAQVLNNEKDLKGNM
jgi:hypothetical protein